MMIVNDGGRAAAGFKGVAGDCVTRAIAIAAEMEYVTVYDALNSLTAAHRSRGKRSSSRTGVPKDITRKYLDMLGWRWTPTMGIGTGCTVHARREELPSGRLILRLSRHCVAMIDGVIHDTYDPTRGGTRCVYGYWKNELDNLDIK